MRVSRLIDNRTEVLKLHQRREQRKTTAILRKVLRLAADCIQFALHVVSLTTHAKAMLDYLKQLNQSYKDHAHRYTPQKLLMQGRPHLN
jgi:hypothetical protein